MTNFISSIAVDDIMDQLAPFVALFMSGGQVVRGQVNRTSMPDDPFATLTELLSVDIDTPYENYDPENDLILMVGPKRIDVQIDFYGERSSDQCAAVKTAFRTGWASDQFPSNIKPLYTNDGIQAPLITGEQQYENRWTLTVSIQYNPVITAPQQFADVATVETTQPVDIFDTLN